ncbi:hypothetical protein [Bradyrhizobium canariense]|uniref:hypothetical protein n=1 Tax=Bradyrhizobium canariense TaxID=255045 RepID=UPI0026901637
MPAFAYASPTEGLAQPVPLDRRAGLLFLIVALLAVIPLSFNPVPFFSYPLSSLSLRSYEEIFLTDR